MTNTNKKTKVVLSIVGITVASIVATIATVVSVIWIYLLIALNDVSGLSFYDDERIVAAYQSDESEAVHFVTENDRLYVTGGYSSSKNAKYKNVKGRKNETLGIWEPVLLFEGSIKTVVPYYGISALVITENNDLYKVNINEQTLLSENIQYVCAGATSYKDYHNYIFTVDTDGNLREITAENSEVIAENVSSAHYSNGIIYALKANGDLFEIPYNSSYDVGEGRVIYSGVKSFDVKTTNTRYTDERGYYYDENAMPVINVLTVNDTLYVKGVYSLYEGWHSSVANPLEPLRSYSDWEIIANNVDSFSLSPKGTLIKHLNGEVAYFGFDTVIGAENVEFAYKKLTDAPVSTISASVYGICILLQDGTIMAWGNDGITAFDCDSNLDTNANILSGTPIIIKQPNS